MYIFVIIAFIYCVTANRLIINLRNPHDATTTQRMFYELYDENDLDDARMDLLKYMYPYHFCYNINYPFKKICNMMFGDKYYVTFHDSLLKMTTIGYDNKYKNLKINPLIIILGMTELEDHTWMLYGHINYFFNKTNVERFVFYNTKPFKATYSQEHSMSILKYMIKYDQGYQKYTICDKYNKCGYMIDYCEDKDYIMCDNIIKI